VAAGIVSSALFGMRGTRLSPLANATMLYREMDMTYWLEKVAEAELEVG
jgi:hypothetical protein